MNPQVHLNCRICEERIREKCKGKSEERKEIKKLVKREELLCEVCGELYKDRFDLAGHINSHHQRKGIRRSERIGKKEDGGMADSPLPSPEANLEEEMRLFILSIKEEELAAMENLDPEEIVKILGL